MLKFKNNNLFKKLHKNQKGMSLVELIIAVTIMSVAIAPLLYSFAHSARYNAKAKKAQRATTAAQTVMENIKAYNLDSVYEKFCVDSEGNHIDTTAFLYNNPTAVYSTTNTYNANAGYADKMGTYKITGMKMSDGPSDSHLYDVDITIAPDKTESLPTYHVYNPSI
ncbi:MAG: type II secretion system protein, partial [Lachnospiraceae bacterium]|nr:type II secretion system protein [Lachnospiraceae bacterium]